MNSAVSLKKCVVIVFTENDAATIPEILHRLHHQSVKDRELEVVAVDLGSTDGTVGLLKRFKPRKIYQFEGGMAMRGQAINRVLGELDDADHVLLLMGHTVPEGAQWLEKLLQQLAFTPKAGLVISPRIPNSRAFPLIGPEIFRSTPAASETWMEDPHIIAACALRLAAWREFPLRTDLVGYELGEWAHRIEQNGWGILSCQEARVQDVKPLTLQQIYKSAFHAAYALAVCRKKEMMAVGHRRLHRNRLIKCFRRNLKDFGKYLRQGRLWHWPRVVLGRVCLVLGEIRGYTRGLRENLSTAAPPLKK